MRKILLFAIILSSLKSFAQTKTIDSMKQALDNYKKVDSVKLVMLYSYSNAVYSTDIDAAIQAIRQAIEFAGKMGRQDFVASLDNRLDFLYKQDNKMDSALLFCLDGLGIAEKMHLDYFIPTFYFSLGDTYRRLDNNERAVYYDNKYLDLATAKKDSVMMLGGLLAIASLEEEQGRWDKVKSDMDRALPLAIALKDQPNLARIYWTKGREYDHENNFQQAMISDRAALNIWKDQQDHTNLTFTMVLLSRIFTEMKNRDSARWYAYGALDSAIKYKLKKEKTDAYLGLFNYHYKFKYYQKALEENMILDSIREEMLDSEPEQTALKAEMKYEQEKKDYIAQVEKEKKEASAQRARNFLYGVIIIFVILAGFLFYNNRQKQRAKSKIEKAYSELKITQAQLIQSEKMASLGELTAGIAHEIQNPLNFVNNFSEVSNELIDEIQEERNKAQGTRNEQMQDEILNDIKQNLEKINHHGKRADAIVKGMLQHSRSSTGTKELTNINALADEYLRLAYHGLRAKDNSLSARQAGFNATMKTDFDESIGKINIIPQDIGRVLLNLYNNAFYAVNEKSKQQIQGYEPTVSVSTKKINDKVVLTVMDNGNGIPQKVVDKIFQPFFTTKPTGQGTGLGLSLSYDIIKAHGGEIRVETKEGESSTFEIQLPVIQ